MSDMSQVLISEGFKALYESVPRDADQKEIEAFYAINQMLENDSPTNYAFVTPRGSDTGFPDFGFNVRTSNRKSIDVHIEFKKDAGAYMGSMRDWVFDGRQYRPGAKAIDDADKELMLLSMNKNPTIVAGGKRLLKAFDDAAKKHGLRVKELANYTLARLAPPKERKLRQAVAQEVKNNNVQQIGNIQGGFGSTIIDFYNKKFKKAIRSSADGSILLFMIKDRVWLMNQDGNVDQDDIKEIAQKFGVREFDSRNFNRSSIDADLEVRISIRKADDLFKQPFIDVKAGMKMRRQSAPRGGTRII